MSKILSKMPRTLAGIAIVAAAGGIMAAAPAHSSSSSAGTSMSLETPSAFADRWLLGLNGKHRQLFDAPAPGGGVVLIHMLNYYDTLVRDYKAKDADIDAVGTFYGSTTFYGVNDAMWAKYKIGEFLETNDAATGKAAVVNPWRTTPNIMGMALPQASVESLQKRGATFILCNNALTIFSGMLAKARGLEANVVYDNLKANILPGVELVPGMVVAIEQAHKAGLSYHRQ
ncbi:MAG: hypothetical protein ACO1Q7_10190 [Gemmatimonas sp.]